MPQTSYDTINSLTEISFIAGTEYILTFDVYDINMSPLSLSGSTCTWTLSPYGQPEYAILTKTGNISGSIPNEFSITLGLADTETLSGKYVQQPIVVDITGNENRPSQGILTIIPRIQN